MAEPTLKERVASLEREVAELRKQLAEAVPQKVWRSTTDTPAGDEVMKAIWDEALKIREKDREKALRRYAKSKMTGT